MKRTSNKLMCLILTAIMLIGLLPAGIIGAADAQTKVVYDLDGAAGSPHVSFLEYGDPHHNWKFFDLCDDFWTILDGGRPSDAANVEEADIKYIKDRAFSASKNNYLRIVTGQYSKYTMKDAWAAIKIKAPHERGIYDMHVEIIASGSSANNVSVWVAPYENGKDDGAYYMTEGNLVIDGQSFSSNGTTARTVTGSGIVNDGVEDFVVVFRLNGQDKSRNFELQMKELSLEKTESMPYLINLSKLETVAGAPTGYKAYMVPSFEMYGMQYANLIAKSGADDSAFDMYFAEYFGGAASEYMTEENLVESDITFDNGEAFINEAFAVLNNTKHILIVGEGVKEVEYDKVRDITYVYDLDGVGGNVHTAFLEYGNPHSNWKFFDLCDDFWTILDGGRPDYASSVSDAEIDYIKIRMFSASKNSYLRIVTGNYDKFTLNNAWAAIKVKAPRERGIYDMNIEIPTSGSYGKNVSVWVAPYEKGKDDGAYYMQDKNLVLFEQSLSSAAGPVVTCHGAVCDGSEELVVIFRLNGQGKTSNFELQMKELSFVKTGEIEKEYTYEINGEETVVASPENFGIYELELSSASGENLSDVVAYLAPNGTPDYRSDANKIVSLASGTEFVGEKLFAAMKGTEKLSLYIENSEKVESVTLRKVERPEIKIALSPARLSAGSEGRAIVTAGGKNVLPWGVTITSSDINVATVENSGEIEAKKPGIVTFAALIGSDMFDESYKTEVATKVAAPNVDTLPESIAASFEVDILEEGKDYAISVVDENGIEVAAGNIDITFDIGDEDVITYDGNYFNAKKPGRTTITVRAEMGEDSVERVIDVVVVGKNLFTRVAANGIGKPVAHGSFENGITPKKSEENGPPANGDSFWFLSNNYIHSKRSYFFNYETVEGDSPKYPGEKTNYLKVDFDWTHKADVENSHLIRFQTAWQRAFDFSSNLGHIGFLKADKNKIYQFSGYFKVDENSEINSTVYAYLRYANDIKNGAINATPDGTWTTPNVYLHNPATTTKADKLTPGQWKYFETAPIYANWPELMKTLDGGDEGVMWLDPYLDISTSKSSNVVFYVSEFAVNEVSFDSVEFTHKGKFETAKTYDTFATTITPLTSRGQEITLGDKTKAFEVKYETSDPRVAKISDSGVITAVSDGECEVYAYVTIGDTTQCGILPVSFSGLEVIFESVEGHISSDMLSVGGNAEVTYKLYNTDGTEYIDSPEKTDDDVRVFYESENPLVAEVDQNGIVTAKAGGKTNIFVYAERGKILAKDYIPISVRDSSGIASVNISGKNAVEKGFETKLSVSGINESGSATLITSAQFDFADDESREFIELSEDGNVYGIKEGVAHVIATITSASGSVKTSDAFAIEVTAENPVNKIIDFRVGVQAAGATKATFEKHGYTVNEDFTDESLVSDANSTKPDAFRWLAEGLFARPKSRGTNTRASDIAFNIKVDYDGWYLPSFTGTYHYYGPTKVEMYLNREYIGNYNFYAPTIFNPGETKKLNPIYLEKGTDNILIFRLASGSTWTYLHNLKLEYLSDIPTVSDVSIEVEKATLAVGETVALDTHAILSNGSEYEFGFLHGYEGNEGYPNNKINPKAYTEYVSSDVNVARIEDGRLVAVAPGSCTVKSIAYFNGAEGVESEEITVTVTDATFERIEVSPVKCETLVDKSTPVTVKAFLSDGSEISKENYKVTVTANNSSVNIDENPYRIYGVANGEAIVTVTVEFNGVQMTKEIPVTVIGRGFAIVNLSAYSQVMRPETAGYDISVECLDASGGVMNAQGATVTFESSDESVVSVSADGHMTPGALGTAEITATVTLDGVTRYGTMNVSVRMGKTERTYYTEDKIKNARDNAKEYEWARTTVKSTINDANKYLDYVDELYEMLPSEGIPRSFITGFVSDPEAYYCRYCGVNLKAEFSDYPWIIDALKNPWKVKCPNCARIFPSNDFGKFYELGKNERGEFNLQYALERHREKFIAEIAEEYGEEYVTMEAPETEYTDEWYKYYGYGIAGGYLTNNLYPNVGSAEDTGFKGRFSENENPKWWGVDNGWGYTTGRKYDNGVAEVHTYIPMFVHNGLWSTNGAGSKFQPAIYRAITNFANAYIYTGEKEYARAGAKLLDRIADFYPDFDLNPYHNIYQNSNQHGKQGGGRILGNIWEAAILGPIYGVSYDAFFDIYEDEELLDYLTEKAIKYNRTDKLVDGRVTSEKLRSNVEKNILEEMLPAVKAGDITGNFGFFQNVLTKTAIVLDDSTLTPEIIRFVMQAGEESGYSGSPCTGGNVLAQIMNIVDRDGFGDESSLSYNSIWANSLISVAEDLLDYAEIRPGYVKEEYNLFKNPKYIKMLQLYYPTAVSGAVFANIGDDNDTGRRTPENIAAGNLNLAKAGYKTTRLPIFAQLLYAANGRKVEDLYTNIYDEDPEAIQKNLEYDIKKYGEIDYSNSQLLSGYGFASLISGDRYSYDTNVKNGNTLRTFWMYFGGGQGHRHMDRMNLGIDFYGYDFSPEFGYPEETGAAGSNVNPRWIAGTLSHNTVTVNEKRQDAVLRASEADIRHFDDSGDIKLMDVNAPLSYREITDIYRRTVVSVDIDDEASYAVDFFRVKGGDEHVYSFHGQSREITFSDNLSFVKQPFGTYAGANIAFGDNAAYAPYSGYNYLYNVRRATNPGTGEFTADFKIEYLRINQTSPKDLGMKLTMLNNFNVTEVASAFGKPPQKGNNPLEFEYLLVKRKGKDLDSLFTAVIEPYKGASKIESITRAEVKRADGRPILESEPAQAVKVTLKGGRCDYIVYAANNQREYIVSDNGEDLFRFKGFAGVYTARNNGPAARIYLHDGTVLDDGKTNAISDGDVPGAIKGKVKTFTKGNVFESFIDLKTSAKIDPDTLLGKVINIETDDTQNGVYRICGAEEIDGGYRISTGNVTLIRALRDSYDTSKGYIYNIEEGANFEIPLTEYITTAPKIMTADGKNEYTTSVGSMLTVPISVICDAGVPLTFDTSALPRGASFDEETMTISWKPTKTQTGENVVSLSVFDGSFEKNLSFVVQVRGSTTPVTKPEVKDPKPDEPTGDNVGGGAAGPVPPAGDEEPEIPEDVETPEDIETPDTPAVTGFKDLGNHSWAEEAINYLAEMGIIKGTSEDTFAPAAKITRADFAILLVRAFKLESDETENFADVAVSDYFARELAIARNTGIVGGIGNNKYAPRSTITRQDMMVIVHRVLEKLGIELKDGDVEHADFDKIPEYAKDAVRALIANGLINGKNGLIDGSANTTRAEVAVLIKRILDFTTSK